MKLLWLAPLAVAGAAALSTAEDRPAARLSISAADTKAFRLASAGQIRSCVIEAGRTDVARVTARDGRNACADVMRSLEHLDSMAWEKDGTVTLQDRAGRPLLRLARDDGPGLLSFEPASAMVSMSPVD